MCLGFLKECIVSLIFLGINLLSLSTSFFWSQLKFIIFTFAIADRSLCSSERDFKNCLNLPKYTASQLLRKLITFASVKLYYLITLISHITQLLPIRKFYCFRSFMLPNDGRSISRNVALLNILVHDVINVLYYQWPKWKGTAKGLKPTTTLFVNENSNHLAKLAS